MRSRIDPETKDVIVILFITFGNLGLIHIGRQMWDTGWPIMGALFGLLGIVGAFCTLDAVFNRHKEE